MRFAIENASLLRIPNPKLAKCLCIYKTFFLVFLNKLGTLIAIYSRVMRLSEIIIIYLTIGAPFAVHFVLHNLPVTKNLFLKAFGVAILWLPLMVVKFFFGRKRQDTDFHKDEKLELAKRSLFVTLNEIRTATELIERKENIERLICVTRENAEKYSGLALASETLNETDSPSEHEFEIFRITGCKSDELKIAARCAHRHNVRQIFEHRNRARANFLHALVEMAEDINNSSAISPISARQINGLLLRLYANSVEILSLIEDEKAVAIVTRLSDKASIRLKVIESEESNQELVGEKECLRTVRHSLAQTSQ